MCPRYGLRFLNFFGQLLAEARCLSLFLFVGFCCYYLLEVCLIVLVTKISSDSKREPLEVQFVLLIISLYELRL